MAIPSSAELPIQEATVDLLRWFIPILHRLPRQHRHGLGERLIILEPLRGRIQLIQLQTRLLHDFQLIDLRRYEHASRLAHGHTWRLRRRLFFSLPYAADLP